MPFQLTLLLQWAQATEYSRQGRCSRLPYSVCRCLHELQVRKIVVVHRNSQHLLKPMLVLHTLGGWIRTFFLSFSLHRVCVAQSFGT